MTASAELTVEGVVAQIDAINNPPKARYQTAEEIQRDEDRYWEDELGVPRGTNAIRLRANPRPVEAFDGGTEGLLSTVLVMGRVKRGLFRRDRRLRMSGKCLMAEYKEGWGIVGFVRYPELIDLPDP